MANTPKNQAAGKAKSTEQQQAERTTPLTTEQIIAELQKQGKSPEEIIAHLAQQLTQTTEELTSSKETIEGQALALAAAEAQGEGQLPVVTHDRQQYRATALEFVYKGQTVKAAELKAKPELVAELVNAGSGILKLVEAE